MNPKTENKNDVTIKADVPVYEDVTTMEDKAIRKELKSLAPRGGKLSLTERNMLECLVEGGNVTRDTRDQKDRHYFCFATYADGSQVSLRPDGFRYLISKADKYGLMSKAEKDGKVVTWTLPKNSGRLAFVRRLVTLFDAV